MIADDVEKYVSIFGEQYRKLIVDSLEWLEEREKVWGVAISRDEFIHDLISHTTAEDK